MNVRKIKKLRKQGRYPVTIARELNMSVNDVRLILAGKKPVRPRKPAIDPAIVSKIRAEYKIMVEGGMKSKDAREELKRWYKLGDNTVYNIVKFRAYNDV